MKKRSIIFGAVLSALACFGLCQQVRAQETPDPGAVGGTLNTADGTNALVNVTTGAGNSVFGWFSLFSDADASFNTAVGAGTLLSNNGANNTAVGAAALLFNNTGSDSTAVGAGVLLHNDGDFNTGVGSFALNNNTTGGDNNAVGYQALTSNVDGGANNAHGNFALSSNVGGGQNNAFGDSAMSENVSGFFNTAVGDDALFHCNGDSNVAVGDEAGIAITTGSNIIAIGAGVSGVSSVFGQLDDSCYIGNIHGNVVSLATAAVVMVDADGKLGTTTPNAAANKMLQPQAVLNEFQKEEKRITELETTVTQQAKTIEVLTAQLKEQSAQIQKVSAQLEISRPAPQVVATKP
jgi:hypothetical protein